MNGLPFTFRDSDLVALPSGALWWPARRVLCVSDLHLGKSERVARRTGQILPPYEARETLARLAADIVRTDPAEVICLGDSFDDPVAARDLEQGALDALAPLMAGRVWIWIEGNHDPGPVERGGTSLAEIARGALTFRHIATTDCAGEVSGHYHPKARITGAGRTMSRPCFLIDESRLILPAYGTYTGGLFTDRPVLADLMGPDARALLMPGAGRAPLTIPMPR